MFREANKEEILHLLEAQGYASVRFLSEQLFISSSSVRRALNELEKDGCVKRSYGGVSLVSPSNQVVFFNARVHEQEDSKRRMAAAAAGLIRQANVLFLDGSTTVLYLADLLEASMNLTVVTNNLKTATVLAEKGIRTYCSGGLIYPEDRFVLLGEHAERLFDSIHANLLFFSCTSVSDNGTVSELTEEESRVRRAMIQNADKAVLMADATKWGWASTYRICDLRQASCVVTDAVLAEDFLTVNGSPRYLHA